MLNLNLKIALILITTLSNVKTTRKLLKLLLLQNQSQFICNRLFYFDLKF